MDSDNEVTDPVNSGLLLTTPSSQRKRGRKDDSGKKKLTVEQRSQLIAEFRSGTMKKAQLALKYGISKPRVTQIIVGEAAKIEDAMSVLEPGSNLRRLVPGKWKDIEETLLAWIEDVKVPLTSSMIQARALAIATERGIQGFNASSGWFARFQRRYGLSRLPSFSDTIGSQSHEDRGSLVSSLDRSLLATHHNTFDSESYQDPEKNQLRLMIEALSEIRSVAQFHCGLDEARANSFHEHISNCMTICTDRLKSMDTVETYDIVPSTSSSSIPNDAGVAVQSAEQSELGGESDNGVLSNLNTSHGFSQLSSSVAAILNHSMPTSSPSPTPTTTSKSTTGRKGYNRSNRGNNKIETEVVEPEKSTDQQTAGDIIGALNSDNATSEDTGKKRRDASENSEELLETQDDSQNKSQTKKPRRKA